MSTTACTGSRSRRQQVVLVLLVLGSLGGAIRFAWPHLSAWANLERGRMSLENEPGAARAHLDRCLATWPDSGAAHFLAAQAARRCGELREASRHLDDAARLGWPDSEVEAERALIRAEFDQLAAAARAYMADFRWPDADAVVNRWLELQPDSPAAWTYRGQILERLRQLPAAAEAYRRATQLAPTDRRAEFDLARVLVESHSAPEEAAGHLEHLNRVDPRNPDVLVLLAVCREVQERRAEAVALLDRVIADHPTYPKAYYFRGRLELNRGKPGVATGYLRRAAEMDPSDQEALYSLFLAVSAVGTPDEVRAAEDRWRRCDTDLKRATELARLIVRSPDDPSLRCEMGELYLRNGRDQDGVRWLQSALSKQPDHVPTHRLLVDYYRRTGRPAMAAHHQPFLTPTPALVVPP